MEARSDELTTEIKSFKESSSKPKTPPAVMRSPIHEKIVLDCKGKPYECYEENFLDGDNLDSVVDLLGYLKSSASFLPEKGHEVTSFGEPYSYTGSRDSEPDPIPPELAKWSKVAPMAVSRVGVGVATLNTNLYAVGGHDGRSYLNTVEMYDPNVDVWKEIKPMRQARGGVGVCTLGARIFAVGGHDGSAALRTVECYDPRAGIWSEMASMDTHRFSAGVGVIRDI